MKKNRKRSHALQVYLNEEEWNLLEAKQQESGLTSKSDLIRMMIQYDDLYHIDYRHLLEYNTELARIGNILNQITQRFHTTGTLYENDIKEIKELMEQIWLTQKSMLSKQPLIKQ